MKSVKVWRAEGDQLGCLCALLSSHQRSKGISGVGLRKDSFQMVHGGRTLRCYSRTFPGLGQRSAPRGASHSADWKKL